jgi:magnesium transporter
MDRTMAKLAKRRSEKAGLPPGALVYVGEQKTEEVKLTIFDYSEASFKEAVTETIEDCASLLNEKPSVRWIKVDGIHQVAVVEKIGECFGLHPLTLEDILNTDQRPKIEEHDQYLCIVLKTLGFDEGEHGIRAEQVSLIVSPGLVVSFQERETDAFRPVIERLRNGKGRLRKMGADYLCYALLDAVVDNYFLVLERMEETVEYLEEEIATSPRPDTIQSIQKVRREMMLLHRSVWPLGEVVNNIVLGDSPLIDEPSKLYFKDVHDHLIQATDTIETNREMLTEMLAMYLSAMSNKLNEVMKVLTIIATIFMPLTFIAGIYGMNFDYMPELRWHWGYGLVMLLMLAVAVCMLIYFRKKRWL